MSTLTEFLLARIAEDEAWAGYSDDLYTDIPAVQTGLMHCPSDRIRAECEAKRRIVELHQDAWGANIHTEWGRAKQGGLNSALRTLASVYSDHPDYRQEWRHG